MGIISILWGILSSGSTVIYGVLSAVAAISAALFFAKRSGTKQEQDRARIEQLERKYEVATSRAQTNENVRGLSDDELERLRVQYELPDSDSGVAGELRGMASDPHEPERQADSQNTGGRSSS